MAAHAKPVAVFCGGSGLRGLYRPLLEAQAPLGVDARLALTFVVAVSDDGGSSRALTDAFGGVAVGDLRNVALSLAEAAWSVASGSAARGDAAVSATMLRHVRALMHRLCATEEGTAVAQLREERHRWAADAAAGCRTSALVSSALTAFSDAASAAMGESEGPSSGAFAFANASVGNLVLIGLLMQQLQRLQIEALDDGGPLTCAVQQFLDDVCGVSDALRLRSRASLPPHTGYAVSSVSVVPVLDYRRAGGAVGAEAPSYVLPRAVLRVLLESGELLIGQRSVSYGLADDVDGAVSDTHRAAHKYQAPPKAAAGRCALPLPSAPVAVTVSYEAATVGAWGLRPFSDRRFAAHVFARGSLVTSTLASAAVHFASETTGGATTPSVPAAEVLLMLNGSRDRETSCFSSWRDVVRCVERVTAPGMGAPVRHVCCPKGSPFDESKAADALGPQLSIIAAKDGGAEGGGCAAYDDGALASWLVSILLA